MAVERNTGSSWVSGLSRFGIRPGLDRTIRVLRYFGDPQSRLRFYHVAGTNGKGSVCANLFRLLRTTWRVGMFTSPAFDGYRGRFVVDDVTIGVDDFERLAQMVERAVAATTPEDPLTEFEALTVMAILYFKECAVDAVVWETGLGGRYDSTNVVTPVVTAITNVGLDHMEILGPTIRHIAADKSGIIKEGCPMVTAATGEALDVIRQHAGDHRARLFVNGVDFGYTRRRDSTSQWLDYRGLKQDVFQVPVVLEGIHQAENSALALAMVEAAAQRGEGPNLTSEQIRSALSQVLWPLRMDVFHFGETKQIVLDGAHNADGARMLALTLRELQSGEESQWTMVIGILRDKDVRAILRPILPLARRVIAVAPGNARALSGAELKDLVAELRPTIEVTEAPSVAAGMEIAFKNSDTKFICCCGSLYTVDEARKAMETMHHSGKQGR